jgi:hypothetical protein
MKSAWENYPHLLARKELGDGREAVAHRRMYNSQISIGKIGDMMLDDSW